MSCFEGGLREGSNDDEGGRCGTTEYACKTRSQEVYVTLQLIL